MTKRELTCIVCPKGCRITVECERGEVLSVSGHTCKRGEKYAKEEVIAPMRTVTGSVRVSGGVLPVVSVKTRSEIPKEKIAACMEDIHSARAKAPVKIGDVLVENAGSSGVDVIATKNVSIKCAKGTTFW